MFKKDKLIFIILFFFLLSCGFTIIDKSKIYNFKIIELTSSGEKRINYLLKNQILSYSSSSDKKLIKLDLELKKNKTIKEKNIKNEILKYDFEISIFVKYFIVNNSMQNSFEIKVSGDYPVAKSNSQTKKNEANLIDTLVQKASSQIALKLAREVNDI